MSLVDALKWSGEQGRGGARERPPGGRPALKTGWGLRGPPAGRLHGDGRLHARAAAARPGLSGASVEPSCCTVGRM